MCEGVEGVFREAAVEEGEGKELLREVPGVALEHSEGDLGQLLVELAELEEAPVVSKPQAMIFSAIPHVSSIVLTVSASTFSANRWVKGYI